jgi:hypothetical protein
MMPLADRKEILKTHPRVTFHEKTTPCTGFSVCRTSVALYHHKDPEVRAAKADKARCKKFARWRFKALGKSWAKDGDFCLSHLIHQGLMADMTESAAFERWYDRKYGKDS